MTPPARVAEIGAIDRARFAEELLPAARPAVFRGLAAHWPAVAAARAGTLPAYLTGLGGGATCALLEGQPAIRGRFAYTDDLTGFNFTRSLTTLAAALDRLTAAATEAEPSALAVQALPAAEALPGFAAANPAPLIDPAASPRLWIGNRVCVATHHDLSRNLAVAVAGRRRFTLFPPQAVADLYLGPLEFSPAGTPISLVDARAPDLDRFPRFARAQAVAQVAELAPGDAIYIPYLWWHQVESLDPLSVLANYWWNEVPAADPGLSPMDVLFHARLAVTAMSAEQRAAWRPLLDHLVFGDAADHLPKDRRGILGGIGGQVRTRLRRDLGAKLGR